MTAIATASSLPTADISDDEDNTEPEAGGGVLDDGETGEADGAPEGFQTPTGGSGSGVQPALDPPRRRRRTRAQIEADAAVARGGDVVNLGQIPQTVLSAPVPATPTRRPRTTHAADPAPEELQALGWLVVQARKQGIAPEEFVAQLRLAIAAWDSTQ